MTERRVLRRLLAVLWIAFGVLSAAFAGGAGFLYRFSETLVVHVGELEGSASDADEAILFGLFLSGLALVALAIRFRSRLDWPDLVAQALLLVVQGGVLSTVPLHLIVDTLWYDRSLVLALWLALYVGLWAAIALGLWGAVRARPKLEPSERRTG